MAASPEKQLSVASVLQKNVDNRIAPEIKKKELLILQKDLLIAETLDVLASPESVHLQFGKDFASHTAAVSRTVIEKDKELDVLSSWSIVVKESLCIGLELMNVGNRRVISDVRGMIEFPMDSQEASQLVMDSQSVLLTVKGYGCPVTTSRIQPNGTAYLITRIPIPVFGAKQKLSIIVSWASKPLGRQTLHNVPFETVLNSEEWCHSRHVLSVVEFDSLGNSPIIREAQDFLQFSKQKLLAVHASQHKLHLTGVSRDTLCSVLERSKLPLQVKLLGKNHLVLCGSIPYDAVRFQCYSGDFGDSVDIFGWGKRDVQRIVNILDLSRYEEKSLNARKNRPEPSEEASIAIDSSLDQLRDLLKEDDARIVQGKTEISGAKCRKLNEKFILAGLSK